MPKYRKKPVVIEAIQWNGSLTCFNKLCNWGARQVMQSPDGRVIIKTLEGDMFANEGDYVIKGIKGELYPCKPEIFEATYEAVDE